MWVLVDGRGVWRQIYRWHRGWSRIVTRFSNALLIVLLWFKALGTLVDYLLMELMILFLSKYFWYCSSKIQKPLKNNFVYFFSEGGWRVSVLLIYSLWLYNLLWGSFGWINFFSNLSFPQRIFEDLNWGKL